MDATPNTWSLTETDTVYLLTDQPIARTNLLTLKSDPESLLSKLLTPTSSQFVINFGLRQLKKESKESSEDFFKRLHSEIKQYLRQKLGLENTIDVRYELSHLSDGEFVFFYLDQPVVETSIAETRQAIASRMTLLCQKLIAREVNLSLLIQALFGLRLKMALLSQGSEYFTIPPAYWNASLYLNVQLTQALNKKTGNGVVEAFKVNVFCSNKLEIAITLHKCKFLVTRAEMQSLPLDEMELMFNIDSMALQTKRRLDARDTKLPFFRDQSGYGKSQAYTYNLVMDHAITELDILDISWQAVIFKAEYEVNHFFKGGDFPLENTLYVVDTGVTLSTEQRAQLYSELHNHFPRCYELSLSEFMTKHSEEQRIKGQSYLVLNQVAKDETSSIVNTPKNNEKQKSYPTFLEVYLAYKKGKAENLDIYTRCKIKQFNDNLNNESSDVVLQGFNVDEKLRSALTYITELKKNDPKKFAADKSKSRSKLNTSIHQVRGKTKRTKTELWFKEVLSNKTTLEIEAGFDGEYTAYFIRRPKNQDHFLGYVTFVISSTVLSIQSSGIATGDLGWLSIEHPVFERIDKLYNGSFYLHCHHTDQLLTAYHSLRVPRIIGNATFNLVDLYAYQEQKKSIAEGQGKSFNATDYEIRRSAKAEQTVLPYYLASGRGKADPLMYSAKLRHHHIYLMPHAEGTYCLVTAAQPANQTLIRQSLIKNIIVLDSSRKMLNPMSTKLTYSYLNSFTVDLLKNDESAKTSLFEKLAKLMVEN